MISDVYNGTKLTLQSTYNAYNELLFAADKRVFFKTF